MYIEPEKTLTGPKCILEGYASRAYDQGADTALWDMTSEALAERVEAVCRSIPPSALADGTAYAAWREEIARDFAARQTD